MHPCFTIPELFIIITETIYADERKGQSSVAALARTCKLFLEPALDVLWRYQITLVPLLRCLPDGVMIVKDYGPHWYRDYSSKIVRILPLAHSNKRSTSNFSLSSGRLYPPIGNVLTIMRHASKH